MPPFDLGKLGDGGLTDEEEKWLEKFFEQSDNPLAPTPTNNYPSVGRNWREKFPKPSQAYAAKCSRVKWQHPEPGVAFSYEEWKRGENGRAVVDVYRPLRGQKSVNITPREPHNFYTISLSDSFADRGLQIVVEIDGIDLAPGESKPASAWQLSGLPNDHIVATTIIHFASENMTLSSGSLTFRVEAHLNPYLHVYGTKTGSNPFHPLEPLADIYGCESYLDLGGDDDINAPGAPAQQILGTVEVPHGRLIAFPNVMQHRVEGFRLLDSARPGRRRWLKLHLVDPHYRVCSTRNVPPQQFDWWYEAGLGTIDWARWEIPAEVVQEIETLVGEFPVTRDDAEEVKEKIREERRRKVEMVNENVPLYCFGDWAADGDSKRWRMG